MFEKKLLGLQYERPSVNVDNDNEYRNVIYWIEMAKIRLYPPNDRSVLSSDSKTWDESFNKYLDDLKYTKARDNRKIVLDWLLTLALQYEMEDTRTKMKMSQEEVAKLVELNSGDYSDVDISSPEFNAELKELARSLDVPYYDEEPLMTLQAIAILLCKLRKSARDLNDDEHNEDGSPSQNKKKKIVSQLDENILNLPFSKKFENDKILNRCANVLRLLYLKDLRELQTDVNNVIVKLQSLTANPKTDSALGKVGK